jgi:hypothetical protein
VFASCRVIGGHDSGGFHIMESLQIVTQINAKLGGHLVEHPTLLADIGKLLATPDDVYLIAGVAHIRNVVAMTFATDYTCTNFGTVFAKMEDNTKAYPVNVRERIPMLLHHPSHL